MSRSLQSGVSWRVVCFAVFGQASLGALCVVADASQSRVYMLKNLSLKLLSATF